MWPQPPEGLKPHHKIRALSQRLKRCATPESSFQQIEKPASLVALRTRLKLHPFGARYDRVLVGKRDVQSGGEDDVVAL
jgi:hypothetical protein